MTEQTHDKPVEIKLPEGTNLTKRAMVTITKEQPVTLTKVQSHLSDIQLIDRNALWDDFKNRMKINNYEVNQAFKELKEVVNKIKNLK